MLLSQSSRIKKDHLIGEKDAAVSRTEGLFKLEICARDPSTT